LSPVRSFGQPCQPLLHPRHSAAIKGVPWLWRHGPPVPEFRHPVAKLNPCPTNALASTTSIDLEDQKRRRATTSTTNRSRSRSLRESTAAEAPSGGTSLRDRHFANDTTRTAAQGPYTGSRRHVRRRPCRWTTLHRRRRTHALGPSAHPRATSSTALHRRRPKVPVMGQALRSDRGRPRWPGASTGADYPDAEKLSGLRIIRDKACAAREVSTNR